MSEQLGRALAPGPFLATASQFVTAVREAGSAEQRIRFLGPSPRAVPRGPLRSQKLRGASTSKVCETTFRPSDDGDGFVLDGAKAFVLEASRAHSDRGRRPTRGFDRCRWDRALRRARRCTGPRDQTR